MSASGDECCRYFGIWVGMLAQVGASGVIDSSDHTWEVAPELGCCRREAAIFGLIVKRGIGLVGFPPTRTGPLIGFDRSGL
jgi:hypothetical protein